MRFFRVIHTRHYNPESGRFSSTAFQPSKAGIISVVHSDCAIETSGTICAHIPKFYPSLAGTPLIYWQIPDSLLPEGFHEEQETSATGDICHYDIHGWKRSIARSIFTALSFSDFTVCLSDAERRLVESDLK